MNKTEITKGFNESVKARLVAGGFTPIEIEHGALMAEMYAATKLVGNPIAAMAVSSTFAKALAMLSENEKTEPQRICEVSDIIYDSAMHAAKGIVADAAQQSAVAAALDDSPAAGPNEVN